MEEASTNKIEIHYKRAKFGRRILAAMIDFILFVCAFLLLFLSCRAIAETIPSYQEKMERMDTIKTESALFVEVDDRLVDVISYNNAFDFAASQKVYNCKMAIMSFVDYMKTHAESKEAYDSLVADIVKATQNKELVNKEGVPYFSVDAEGMIVHNPDCKYVKVMDYYDNFYTDAIDVICRSHLITSVPGYYDITKYFSNILFFIEIPISYGLAGILIYFVPTLFFRRGRKTLGKALYHIGVVDEHLLNPKFGRSLARFSIFYFAELILSLFTLGIPVIISFSMMAFSKNKQGFHDYMLGLYEVDTSENNIYFDYDEITLGQLKKSKTPVNFQMSRSE